MAYADDHSTVNSSIQGAQHSIHLISTWLKWTKCMIAKPKKCKSLALSLSELGFRTHITSETKTYSSFDPKLIISGSLINFIGLSPFKFLGGKVFADLSDSAIRHEVTQMFNSYFNTIDALFLKGTAKAWLYNNYVLAFMA